MDLIDGKWLGALACAAGWTTLFSCFNRPGIRGYRNLGILACYAIGLAMFARLPWRSAIATWGLAGVASGVTYFAWEWWVFLKTKDKSESTRPGPSTIVHGLLVWPIMLPEVVEYGLAEAGILKAAPTPSPPPGDADALAPEAASSDG